MSVFKWCPEGFEGFLEVKELLYVERMQMLIDSGFCISMNGTIEKIDNILQLAIKNFELFQKVVSVVQLKHVAYGVQFSSAEELGRSEEGVAVIGEIAKLMVSGFPLASRLG